MPLKIEMSPESVRPVVVCDGVASRSPMPATATTSGRRRSIPV